MNRHSKYKYYYLVNSTFIFLCIQYIEFIVEQIVKGAGTIGMSNISFLEAFGSLGNKGLLNK